MTDTMLRIDGPSRDGRLHGFAAFWLMYPKAFDATNHCMKCFIGAKDTRVRRDMAMGEPMELASLALDQYAYLCGVTWDYALCWKRGGRQSDYIQDNLHVPVKRAPGSRVVVPTYNGLTVTVEDAELVPIPELDPKWRHLPQTFTRCRNFRFAAAYLPEATRKPQKTLF